MASYISVFLPAVQKLALAHSFRTVFTGLQSSQASQPTACPGRLDHRPVYFVRQMQEVAVVRDYARRFFGALILHGGNSPFCSRRTWKTNSPKAARAAQNPAQTPVFFCAILFCVKKQVLGLKKAHFLTSCGRNKSRRRTKKRTKPSRGNRHENRGIPATAHFDVRRGAL